MIYGNLIWQRKTIFPYASSPANFIPGCSVKVILSKKQSNWVAIAPMNRSPLKWYSYGIWKVFMKVHIIEVAWSSLCVTGNNRKDSSSRNISAISGKFQCSISRVSCLRLFHPLILHSFFIKGYWADPDYHSPEFQPWMSHIFISIFRINILCRALKES